MPKGSEELTNARREEILSACEKLYQTMNFKEITLKEIGNVTSFTRTSIYNYFQTKEEIFLALLQREYERWNEELEGALDDREPMTRERFAGLLADSLSRRELLLKILSMNLYDIEENSRLEKLVEFKKEYGRSLILVGRLCEKIMDMKSEECQEFVYTFFPFVYGIYPYTMVTEKQNAAMEQAGLTHHHYTLRELTLMGAKRLLEIA